VMRKFRSGKYLVRWGTRSLSGGDLSGFAGGLVVCASWENRSAAIWTAISAVNVNRIILLTFANKGTTKVSGNIRNKVRALAKANRISIINIEIDSLESTSRAYRDAVVRVVKEIGSTEFEWIVDITAMPRRVWCGILFLLDSLDFKRITKFFYAHPVYQFEDTSEGAQIYRYTSGAWKLEEVPFSSNRFGNGLYKKNIISIGFEYDALKGVLNDHAADHNYIIYPSPGFVEAYTEIAERSAERIKNIFEMQESNMLRVDINDLGGVRAAAVAAMDDGVPGKWDLSILCLGNKLHSLALAFAKMEYAETNFYTRVPRVYKEKNTPCSGCYEMIEVENFHAPL
jgi:hypothetical protein